MSELANLTSTQLAKLAKFIKEKESLLNKRDALQAKIDKVDDAISKIGVTPAATPTKRRGRKPGRKPGRKVVSAKAGAKKTAAKKTTRKRGALKENILSLLKASGDKGITVKEIAAKLKVNTVNVHSWFQTTGKKLPGITKSGRAQYKLK